MPGIGAFISAGRSLDAALDRVRLAEELGFDSVFTTHIAGRDSLSLLMAYASVTERVRLGTGVVPIFSRTPASMAQTTATIDEFADGRMVLGIGVSHQVTVENWYGAAVSGCRRYVPRHRRPPGWRFRRRPARRRRAHLATIPPTRLGSNTSAVAIGRPPTISMPCSSRGQLRRRPP